VLVSAGCMYWQACGMLPGSPVPLARRSGVLRNPVREGADDRGLFKESVIVLILTGMGTRGNLP
jgi:hypothetical protein